jgi:peptidoglycan/LPS O-acetylase OafA/YrhL
MKPSFSVYLDVLRFLAAVLVFFGHVPKYLEYNLWQLSGLSDEAVIIFFVLSGFVISYVIFDRKETALQYAAKRFSRIYSIALPALIFTVGAYYLGKYISPEALAPIDRSFSDPALTFFKGLFFLNESWGATTVFSNLPYWSLAFEVQYYVFFGVMVFMTRKLKWLILATLLLIMGPAIVLYLPIWLAGGLCFFLYKRVPMGRTVAQAGAILSFMGIAVLCLNGVQDTINTFGRTIFPDIVYESINQNRHKFLADYALTVFVMLHMWFASKCFTGRNLLSAKTDGLIQYAASHTFALYLFHMPLMYVMNALFPFSEQPIMAVISIVILTPLIVWGISIYIERTKHAYTDLFYAMHSKAKARWR